MCRQKCYRVVYGCFERARQWLNRWLWACKVLSSSPTSNRATPSRTRLAAVPRPRPQSRAGIVALLGPTRTSAAALQAQRRVRKARGSLFEASDAACTSRTRRTSGVKREGASTADGAASRLRCLWGSVWLRARAPPQNHNVKKKKMVATLQGHRDAVKDPAHRARLWARPATSDEPQQVDALLTWVENLWRELKIKEEDRQLFLEANNLPSRNLVDRLQRTVYAELVSEPTKRPKSASSSRPKTAPFPDARRQKDVDQRCAPLAAHARLLLRFRRATLRALREIESREKLVKRVKDCFRRYRGAPPPKRKKRTSTIYDDDDEAQPPSSETQIKEALADLKATLAAVERSHGARRRRRRGVALLPVAARTLPLERVEIISEKCTTDSFLGECACPEGVRKPDRRLAAAFGPLGVAPSDELRLVARADQVRIRARGAEKRRVTGPGLIEEVDPPHAFVAAALREERTARRRPMRQHGRV